MTVSIKVESKGASEKIIFLGERFDFGVVEQFRKSYETIGQTKNFLVSVDFSRTRYMDSSALGMLINAKTYLNKGESKIKIINVNDKIRKIFTISRFEKKFEII